MSPEGETTFSVTEEQKKLSVEEKLDLIDREIRELYDECVKRGYSAAEIEKCAQPILGYVKAAQRKKWMNRALFLGIFIALGLALFYYNPTYKFIAACARIGSIKLLPIWNWQTLYSKDCLVQNPYYKEEEMTEDNCVCENTTSIKRISDAHDHNLIADYLMDDVPFIVTDATDKWPAREKFNLQFISDLYQENKVLQTDQPCFIKSNIKLKKGQHRTLMKKSAQGKIDDWFAYWDNCDLKATKVFRQFYSRPYFMPNMVELTESNWLMIVKNYTASKYKPYVTESSLIWFAQIRGETPIKVKPRSPCTEICQKLEDTVKEGEMLVVTNNLWYFDFKPQTETESIVLASTGMFDQ